MRLADLGEFGIIDRIRRLLPATSTDVVVGIGDDVAVLDTGGPHYLLATCDIQVENVHFVRHGISPPGNMPRAVFVPADGWQNLHTRTGRRIEIIEDFRSACRIHCPLSRRKPQPIAG